MERNIEAITKFIFVQDDLEQSDIIFVPGSSKHEMAEQAAELFKKGYAEYILPAGKYSSKLDSFPNEKISKKEYKKEFSTDWAFNSYVLEKNGVPFNKILLENQSTHTKENAFFSKEVTDSLNKSIKKAIICCQSFHARRVLITYQWAYPETCFFISPSDTQGINKDNWYKNEYGISRVLGEVEKCGKYFANYFNSNL